jgi:hypothetical protein
MVAMSQLIPKEPKEQASVLGVLREHPELQGFIARATERAREIFTEPEIHLDTVRYDEWDPPLRLIIRAPMPMPEYRQAFERYLEWLSPNPEYNRDLILVFPQYWGPVNRES